MNIQTNANHCLILVAHGSRRNNANNEVLTLTHQLQQHIDQTPYDQIVCGFVELASPSVIDACRQLINDANTPSITVDLMPYFLSSGNHVEKDIPALVQTISQMPSVNACQQLDYIGKEQALFSFLLARMNRKP
ncbi:MAG: CbiX/SirB N-terminal domain-containing protein [Cellvibrionales bacterium]|nr:CbiX/SirB N-terminal domain-containing protein [Cellvibrionales bacterium]